MSVGVGFYVCAWVALSEFILRTMGWLEGSSFSKSRSLLLSLVSDNSPMIRALL